MEKLLLLNAPVLTEFGDFRFKRLSLDEAQALIKEFADASKPIISAIGHAATAEIMTALLQHPVAANRCEVRQTTAEVALVFKLKARMPEGKVLNREEIETLGYDFGQLIRLA